MNQQLGLFKYKAAKVFRMHQAFIVLLFVLTILIGVVIRINTLGNMPIDQTYLNQETAKIKTVKFNEESIEKIRTLNDSNVTVPRTDLPSNRQNPFNE